MALRSWRFSLLNYPSWFYETPKQKSCSLGQLRWVAQTLTPFFSTAAIHTKLFFRISPVHVRNPYLTSCLWFLISVIWPSHLNFSPPKKKLHLSIIRK